MHAQLVTLKGLAQQQPRVTSDGSLEVISNLSSSGLLLFSIQNLSPFPILLLDVNRVLLLLLAETHTLGGGERSNPQGKNITIRNMGLLVSQKTPQGLWGVFLLVPLLLVLVGMDLFKVPRRAETMTLEKLLRAPQMTSDVDFHEYSMSRIRALVNESTIMNWRDESFAPFKALFDSEWVNETYNTDVWKDATSSRPFVLIDGNNDLCRAAKAFYNAGAVKKHILLSHMNENWGAVSTHVPNRTIDWGQPSCLNEILAYVNHNNTLAVFTVQHQAFDHPKVHSIPLGVKEPKEHVLEQVRKP